MLSDIQSIQHMTLCLFATYTYYVKVTKNFCLILCKRGSIPLLSISLSADSDSGKLKRE